MKLFSIILLFVFVGCKTKKQEPVPEKVQQFIFGPGTIKTIIDETTARTLHKDYLDNPITNLKDKAGNKIRGWYINQKDLDIISTNAKAGARVYLGYDGMTYHIIMLAVNSDSSNYLVDESVIDDFLPCPTECPNDKQDKTVWQSDLNYLKKSAAGYHFKNFKGSPEVIKN